MQITSYWEGSHRCRVEIGQFEVRVDEPPEYGCDDTGPSPTQLLLAAIASCFTLAIAHVARKRDQSVPGLNVSITGEYEGPRFNRIQVQAAANIPTADLESFLARAAEVCYVSNTITRDCEIEYVVAGKAIHG
jgi:uncharacterized OsmC-like protein